MKKNTSVIFILLLLSYTYIVLSADNPPPHTPSFAPPTPPYSASPAPPSIASPPPPYSASPPPPSSADELALLKIKQQLGNPSHLSSWVAGANFCYQYLNVLCTPGTNRVSYLFFESYDLTAPFPDAICELTELRSLYIYLPGLYGHIPSCINNLLNLIVLFIQGTSLSGPIPDFHDHQNLTAIVVTTNQLSGPIPPSLLAIPSLQFLDLSSNYLTGTVPEPSHHSPDVLVFNNNSLTGELPKCYGWVDFNRIELANNQLRGDASFLFGKQKEAQWINLSNNKFEFDLSNVEFSTSLVTLNLSHNKIWGKVPDSAVLAKALWILDVSYNKLCGQIPQNGTWQYKAEYFVENKCLCGHPLPPCWKP